MAPPKTRRPGFSRRAQYGLFIGYVVAVGGVLFAVLLLIVAMVDPRGFNALRGAALDATLPISSAGRAVVRGVTNSGEAVSHYFMAASQNDDLKRQLEATHNRLVEARALELENRRLKRLLKLTKDLTEEVATTRIVSSSFDSSRRLATIAAGRGDGVQIGYPVRAPEGLIGRVVETGHFASRVLLLTDGASNVPVQLAREGTPAMATGLGDGTIEIKPLELGENPFKRGDVFVTSGTGGIYAPGIPVAMVVSADRDRTIARPLADPARIDFAVVQSLYEPAAGEPLAPAPTQTADAAQ
ncbi:rod shape-determining protein MreC [Sphingosinicella humi]|uniref:Cell shape-determining protein MreC n=1 Tax=Allosphingosinicella humi TaxID=2068657 RepID=A0A2U2J5Q8_9SPHN|nr:rod shape-determining protein MreC [Sphingosinicella humi]PWG03683.1 rod shape-determining protein MreC [Sphingosinicella humi]